MASVAYPWQSALASRNTVPRKQFGFNIFIFGRSFFPPAGWRCHRDIGYSDKPTRPASVTPRLHTQPGIGDMTAAASAIRQIIQVPAQTPVYLEHNWPRRLK